MNPAHHYVQVVQDDQFFFNFFGLLRAGLELLGMNTHGRAGLFLDAWK